jgi:hypothetical protein
MIRLLFNVSALLFDLAYSPPSGKLLQLLH